MSEAPTTEKPGAPEARRIQAVVALRLLEVIRDQDLPPEILQDEDPSRTIPRRFGLSDVVDRQIRNYQADVRKGGRLTDSEVRDLFRFVNRRPDGREVFQNVGRSLVEPGGRWTRVLPRVARFGAARARARKRLRKLFGRPMGGFARGPFIMEGRSLLLVEIDPGGDACHLLSGFCETVLEQVTGERVPVVHSLCQARGDAQCRWEAQVDKPGNAV